MVKEMVTATKTCSQCGHNGHNARTCLNGGVNKGSVKLFGVNISSDPVRSPPEVTALRKSLSLGNLESLLANDDGNGSDPIAVVEDSGYHSDGQIHSRKSKVSHDKKKGKPWTEEEHRVFLVGLKELGKGDWRGIAKKYVMTRTPTQVASHAQKYFIRLNANHDKKKRRASLFDLSLEDQKEREKSQVTDASSSSSKSVVSKQPITGTQEPVQGVLSHQTEIANRFQNMSMEYMPMYPPIPPYYNFSPFMFHPMYYANPEPVRFIHPSGIPVPRHIPIPMVMPQSQANEASNMRKRDGLELDLGLPSPSPPPQANGASDLGAHGVIHVN